jgi:glycosyltransferase involved in cell wall biosynthesis
MEATTSRTEVGTTVDDGRSAASWSGWGDRGEAAPVRTAELDETRAPVRDGAPHANDAPHRNGPPRLLCEHDGFRLFAWNGRVHAVPNLFGAALVSDPALHRAVVVATGESVGEVGALLARFDRDAFSTIDHVEALGGFALVRWGDTSWFAVPGSTLEIDLVDLARGDHPQVLTADSLPALRRKVLAACAEDPRPNDPDRANHLLFVRNGDLVTAVPPGTLGVDLRDRRDDPVRGVRRGADRYRILEAIARDAAHTVVEYSGWLRCFQTFGNCGKHPQFAHMTLPPRGYEFRATDQSFLEQAGGKRWRRRVLQVRRGLQVGTAAAKLFATCVRRGLPVRETLRFLRQRDFASQMRLPTDAPLTFVPSIPYTYGHRPWVIEIEDATTLFFPEVHNGGTYDVRIRETAMFGPLKALLEDDSCRAIVSHIRDTAANLPRLFGSEAIAAKTHHVTMGVHLPEEFQRHEDRADRDEIRLLFTNSWHQSSTGFYLRGGLEALEAFAILARQHPRLRLVIRSALPEDLPSRFRRIVQQDNVEVHDHFLPGPRLDALRASCHLYLLPSARIHIVSLLQAMSHGLVPVVSDGWGMTEYVDEGRNGLVVPGRYGTVSWSDPQAGMLREDYRAMFSCDAGVAQGVVESVGRVLEDDGLRRALGRTARRDVETRFSLAQWNRGLQTVLDRAVGRK